MHDKTFATDFAHEALKGAPPVVVAASSALAGIDWQTWVLIATLIYVVMQIGWLGWRMIEKAFAKKTDQDDAFADLVERLVEKHQADKEL